MRAWLVPLAASLALHALAAAPTYGPVSGNADHAVTISYLEPEPEAPRRPGRDIRAHIPGTDPRDGAFANKTAVRDSAELLTDPQAGLVFHRYFVRLKEKIHQVTRRRIGKPAGAGSVSLSFMLDRGGRLERASVIGAESSAPEDLRAFAVDCLKASAPFDPFPKELHSAKIVFRVTVLFGEAAS
jgi:outer membrane biosynthesis protein TonB